MWLEEDGVLHAEGLDNPLVGLSPELQDRIRNSDRREVREAIKALRSYFQELFAIVEESPEDLGDLKFQGVSLPAGVDLPDEPAVAPLSAALISALRVSPLRWRLELATACLGGLFELRPSRFARLRLRRR